MAPPARIGPYQVVREAAVEVLLGDGGVVRRGSRPYASLALTPDGGRLLAGTWSGVVEVWPAPGR